MSADVKELTATELADLYDEKLPCARAGLVCLTPGVWRAKLDCGHWGVLCDKHHAEAELMRASKPRHWICLWCKARTEKLDWRRL